MLFHTNTTGATAPYAAAAASAARYHFTLMEAVRAYEHCFPFSASEFSKRNHIGAHTHNGAVQCSALSLL